MCTGHLNGIRFLSPPIFLPLTPLRCLICLLLIRLRCLIELLEAARKGIPVVLVQIGRSGFTLSDARDFAHDIERRMRDLNPAGLTFLRQQLGPDLSELREALLKTLDSNQQDAPVFDAHAADLQMVAAMKDLVERMGEAVGRPVEWEKERRVVKSSFAGKPRRQSLVHKPANAVFVCCSHKDALAHARVLRSQLEQRLGRSCCVGTSSTSNLVSESELLVVLLTKCVLSTPRALLELWVALTCEMPIVLVAVQGAGYDYSEAALFLNRFPESIEEARPGSIAELRPHIPDGLDLVAMGRMLHAHVTAIIAISWSPEGSKNQTDAVVDHIIQRIPRKKHNNEEVTKAKGGHISLHYAGKRQKSLSGNEPETMSNSSRRASSHHSTAARFTEYVHVYQRTSHAPNVRRTFGRWALQARVQSGHQERSKWG